MIILITGLPGTGKTTLAKALATKLKYELISSDLVRINMNKQGQYEWEDRYMVYQEMLAQTQVLVSQNKSVILDATFLREEFRNLFLTFAHEVEVPVLLIRLHDQKEVIEKRLAIPRKESEADFKVYQKLSSQWDHLQLPHLSLFPSRSTLEEMVEQILFHLTFLTI